jgi:hypothetical protein
MWREERSFRQARTYVVIALVIAILGFFVTTKEEMKRRALNLGDRMEASQCDDGDRLCVIPVLLSIAATWQSGEETHQTPFFQSSLVNTTAHMASSPLLDRPSALMFGLVLSLPLSPMTAPPIPRSTMPKSMACTARLSL